MEKDFKGDQRLKTKYEEYIKDINGSYINGKSICFAGSHGVGKSLVSACILKKFCQKGYSALYCDMSNVISVLTQAPNEEKFIAKKELCCIDILVLDELDNRFFNTEASSELFAKSFESIFRTRLQNKLPTLICTNSPNILESFPPNLKQSIGSLFANGIEMFSILAQDFRKRENNMIDIIKINHNQNNTENDLEIYANGKIFVRLKINDKKVEEWKSCWYGTITEDIRIMCGNQKMQFVDIIKMIINGTTYNVSK
jgi:hypothetical protein